MKSKFSIKGIFTMCVMFLLTLTVTAQINKQPVQTESDKEEKTTVKGHRSEKFSDSYRKVYQETNVEKLSQMHVQFNARSTRLKTNAKSFALLNNIPMRVVTADKTMELMQVLEDGTPIYYETKNVDAAISTRTNYLNTGGGLGLDLNGDGLTANVWDGGHGRITHDEYDGTGGNNRLTLIDTGTEGGTQLNFHAAHVSGTIMSSGQGGNGSSASSKGMAWQCDVRGAMWNNDEAEATTEAANGMLVSNHSYGFRGDLIPDEWFGAYIQDSEDWDNIMYNAPYYLMVVAAGNDGNQNGYNGSPLSGNTLYDKLSGHATSKNNLVVANGQDANINPDGSLNSVARNTGSSEGPTDDFRIKPDIMGNGTGLTSTYQGADDQYGTISGTSMASPNVSGSLLLLQEHYNNLNSNFMRAATLKGLALHTADDAATNGPDAETGWGLLNAKRAAETIITAQAASGSAIIEELTLTQGQTYQITVQSNGVDPLQASISWTDPAGNGFAMTDPPPFAANANNPTLVNDLDLRLDNGASFTPWRLTAVNANGTGDNDVDPYERVDINGASGSYTLTVTHKGTLSSSQNYSLIVTGIVVATTPIVAYAASSGNQDEFSECGYTDVNIPVSIAQGPTADTTVNFAIAGGTASNGSDYDIQTPSLVFLTGIATTQNLVVRVYHDGFVEGDETAIIDFTVDANGGDATADTNNDSFTLTINDDDTAPTPTMSVVLVDEDFETTPLNWASFDQDGDGNNWIIGAVGAAHVSTNQLYSRSWISDGSPSGLALTPNNYIFSDVITIPNGLTSLDLTYQVAPATLTNSWYEEYYTIYWATDISTLALVNASPQVKPEGIIAQAVVNETLDMTPYLGQTGYLVIRHFNCTDEEYIAIDDFMLAGVVSTDVQTAVNTGAPDQVNIPTSGVVYTSDPGSGDLMADISNNNTDDYGCVDIAVSRAGTGAQAYNGSTLPNLVMDKRFTMSSSNVVASGNTNVAFYFTENEIAGWETGVGGTIGTTRSTLLAAREVGGSIEEIVALTIGSFGSHVTLAGDFTDLAGDFYFGPVEAFISCAGVTKTWDGANWIPAGTPTSSDMVIFDGNYDTSTADIEACSIIVNSGVILTVNGSSYMRADSDIYVIGTGSLIVEHEGIVVQVDGTASVVKSPTATINVEITTPVLNNRDFMVMGSPMDTEQRTGVFSSAFLVLNSTPTNFMPHPGVPMGGTNFADDKLNNGKFWEVYSGAINAGEGFIVRPQTGYGDPAGIPYNMTYELGTLNNGDVTRTIDFNGLIDNPSGTPNMLANPYASPISVSSLMSANPIINEVYFWEHLTPPSSAIPGSNPMNFSMDDLSMHNGSMGMPAANDMSPGGVDTTPNGVISTGQGFAMKAQAAGSVTFTNAMRLTTGNNTLRNPEAEASIDRLMLEVRNTNYGVGSYTGVAFNPSATIQLDAGFDTNRLATFVSLFSHLQDGSEQLGIQTMPAFDAAMKIPLGFTTQVDEELEYIISIASIEGTQITAATTYLIDTLLGTVTNLNESDYVFRSGKSTYENRFKLVFETEAILGSQDILTQSIGMYPNPAANNLFVVSQQLPINQIVLHDISGRKVFVKAIASEKTVQIDVSNLEAAVYFVSVSTERGTITKRLIKE